MELASSWASIWNWCLTDLTAVFFLPCYYIVWTILSLTVIDERSELWGTQDSVISEVTSFTTVLDFICKQSFFLVGGIKDNGQFSGVIVPYWASTCLSQPVPGPSSVECWVVRLAQKLLGLSGYQNHRRGLLINTWTWAYPEFPVWKDLEGPRKDLDHKVLKGSMWVLKPLSQHHTLRTSRVEDPQILWVLMVYDLPEPVSWRAPQKVSWCPHFEYSVGVWEMSPTCWCVWTLVLQLVVHCLCCGTFRGGALLEEYVMGVGAESS